MALQQLVVRTPLLSHLFDVERLAQIGIFPLLASLECSERELLPKCKEQMTNKHKTRLAPNLVSSSFMISTGPKPMRQPLCYIGK